MVRSTCSTYPRPGVRSPRRRPSDDGSFVTYGCRQRISGLTQVVEVAPRSLVRMFTAVVLVIAVAVQLPAQCLAIENLALNLDLNQIRVFGGQLEHLDGEFGASTVLHRESEELTWALYGAPRGQMDDISLPSTDRTGVVYKCSMSSSQPNCVKSFGSRVYQRDFESQLQGTWKIIAANMSLGLTMAHDDTHNLTTVCAPRQILELSYKAGDQFFMVGSCYEFSQHFNPKRVLGQQNELVSFEDISQRDARNGELVYVNGMRQMGMSIDVRNMNMSIGAPGFESWRGKALLVDSSSNQGTVSSPVNGSASYAGYSVANIYIKNEHYIVQGAPRGAGAFGEVLISSYSATEFRGTIASFQGTQMGEYFGAAVAVADINGDKIDDLLVGAPMYSPTEETRDHDGMVTSKLSKGSFDQGRVYVYLGSPDGIDNEAAYHLEAPNRAKGARFGSTLVRVGDLDKDGCHEVAIGAPFEERDSGSGAVYLLRGCTKRDENKEYPLIRLVPPSTGHIVRGFGYSISQGNDVSGNGYLDVSIGAVLSGHGFVYRARPVVLINSTIKAAKTIIPEGPGDCTVNGRAGYFCTVLTACVSYEHPRYEKRTSTGHTELVVLLRFQADPARSNVRGFVKNLADGNYQATATYELTLQRPQQFACTQVQVGIMPAMDGTRQSQDILKAVEFRMTTTLKRTALPNGVFCADCPVISSPSAVTAPISYKVPCKDPKCLVRLHLSAQIEGVANGTEIALGRTTPLELKIQVSADENLDTAFNTQVVVRLNEGLLFNNPDKCTRNDKSDGGVTCLIDSQFQAGASRKLILKLDLDTDSGRNIVGAMLGLEVELKTESKDENAARNKLRFVYSLVKLADVGVAGRDVKQISMFNKTTSLTVFQHVYTVTKYHDSEVSLVILHIDVPVATKKSYSPEHQFVSIAHDNERDGRRVNGLKCSEVLLNTRRRRDSSSSTEQQPREISSTLSNLIPSSASLTLPASSIRELVMDCESSMCKRLTCALGPFVRDQSRMTYVVNLQLNITRLIQEVHAIPEHIIFRSHANIKMVNSEQFSFGVFEHPKSAQIQTSLFREGRPLGPGIPWWWLLLAVLLGLLVVALIIFALYKCGFFRRSDREALDEMQKEPQSASPILGSMSPQSQTHIVSQQHNHRLGHPHSPVNNMIDHAVDDNDNDTFRDSTV